MTVATRDPVGLGMSVPQTGRQAGLVNRRAESRQLGGGRGALGASRLAGRAPIMVAGAACAAGPVDTAQPLRDPARPRLTERRFVRDPGTSPMPVRAAAVAAALEAIPAVRTPAPVFAAPKVRRLQRDEDRRYGSFAAYLAVLIASALVGVLVAWFFSAPAVRLCTGGDAVGACIKDKVFAPAVTTFALILAAGAVLATLIVDVLPDARRKRRAGYRLKQDARRAAPRRTGGPPMPADRLAVACWSPAQGAGTVDRVAAAAALRPIRAVCPTCVTVVTARAGTCLECGGTVVARRA